MTCLYDLLWGRNSSGIFVSALISSICLFNFCLFAAKTELKYQHQTGYFKENESGYSPDYAPCSALESDCTTPNTTMLLTVHDVTEYTTLALFIIIYVLRAYAAGLWMDKRLQH